MVDTYDSDTNNKETRPLMKLTTRGQDPAPAPLPLPVSNAL